MRRDSTMRAAERRRVVGEPAPRRLWRLLGSPRLALILILVLVVLGLIGALLIQVPSEIASDPVSYQLWIANVARPRFGAWTDSLSFLRLFDVFHSPWFLAAGGLLMVNIVVCVANRRKTIALVLSGGTVRQGAEFFGKGADRLELFVASSTSKTVSLVSGLLREQRYRVRSEESGESVTVAADRNRFSTLGTLVAHLGLLILVLGFVAGSFWGFRDNSFVVAEGSARDVGHDTDLSLELKSFEDDYWPDGSPKDYRSEVVLYSGQQEVKQALVRVNYPLAFQGINFYQSGFGPAPRIRVTDGQTQIYDQPVPLLDVVQGQDYLFRYAGEFRLADSGTVVQVVGSSRSGQDTLIGKDRVAILVQEPGTSQYATGLLDKGAPLEVGGLQFTFVDQQQYSVFQVSHRPGIESIWIACAFFVVGVAVVFYFPHRQLWVLVEPDKTGVSRVVIRATGKSSPNPDELSALRLQIEENGTDNQRK
jgi:cytochrome c biogenesis protein